MHATNLIHDAMRVVVPSVAHPGSFGILAVAVILQLGCATQRPIGVIRAGSPVVSPVIDPGVIVVTAPGAAAEFSFDKSDGRSGYAGEGAGNYARAVLTPPEGGPPASLLMGAIGLILAPPAAAAGAVSASRAQIESNALARAEQALRWNLASAAEQKRLRDAFLKAAGDSTRRRLVPAESAFDPAVRGGRVGAVLETKVEELRLERTSSSDTSFALRMKTRARLIRSSDGAVVYDQPFEYLSGTALFHDWSLDSVLKVADTGYRKLAEEMTGRLLLGTRDAPVLSGAGFKGSTRRASPLPTSYASTTPANPSVMRAGSAPSPISNAGIFGVYSTSNVPGIVVQLPPTMEDAVTDAIKFTEHTVEDFTHHPNPEIQAIGFAVAIPISLWNQAVAIARGVPEKRHVEASKRLMAAVRDARPHYALAKEVASQLAPRTAQRVAYVPKPPPTGDTRQTALMQCADRGTFCALPAAMTAEDYLLSQGVNTALEINVQSAILKGGDGVNPPLSLCIEARATVFRSSDGHELYSCPVRYRGQSRQFTEWAANDAQLFREEIQRANTEMSRGITGQLVSRGVVAPLHGSNPVLAVAE